MPWAPVRVRVWGARPAARRSRPSPQPTSPVLQPQPLCGPQPAAGAHTAAWPHRRSSPASADLSPRNLACRDGSAPPPRAGVSSAGDQEPAPAASALLHPRTCPVQALAPPALLGWPPAKCPLGPLVVGGSGSKLCCPGTLQRARPSTPPTRGAITLCSVRSAPPGGPLRQPDPSKSSSSLHTSPHLSRLHSPSPDPSARKVLSQVLGPQVSAVSLCWLPPPGVSPYSCSAPSGWRVASHQNRIGRWAPCSQV